MSDITLYNGMMVGQYGAQIPISGRIRPGIKVLTKDYYSNDTAVRMYKSGLAEGIGFAAIESNIMKELKLQKSPMRPMNVPYFTVHKKDFTTPESADQIMRMYSENKGDGFHLYKFPIILPLDNIMSIMPHTLRCFTANELKYWSAHEQDGVRYCYTRASVPVDEQGKAKRILGGRKIIKRQDIKDGICDPENCQEFQSQKCKLTGAFVFYVPGVSGAGAIELPTNSTYAMDGAAKLFSMVSAARRGRISGTWNGKPIFWVTKKKEKISRLENGKPTKTDQWIIKIEADIDMEQAFIELEPNRVEGLSITNSLQLDDEEFDYTDGLSPAHQTDAMTGVLSGSQEPDHSPLIDCIKGHCVRLGIDFIKMQKYIASIYGADWDKDEKKMYEIEKRLTITTDDMANAFRNKIDEFSQR